ncbi:MAG TPA: hypothetical protein VF138_06485 [Caulobacteraceae bacterium]
MRTKAAFATAAALAAVIAALLPIPHDSDAGSAHAASWPALFQG